MTAGGGDRNIEELKSLVLSTLETNGVLGQIRAQLRANVYKAIECDEDQVSAAASPGHSKLMKSQHARLIAEIVAEFFVFYDFKHSLSVFIPEVSLGRERRNRIDVASDAGLSDVALDSSILEQLIAATTASKQMGRPQGEQPQPQRRQQRQKQQKQQKQQQKQQKQQQSAASPEPQRVSAESLVQTQASDGSSAQEEGSAKAAISVPPEQQDPQAAPWGDSLDRRAARSEEFSVADSLGGPATTHDSFDEEFDRKMEEQIDSKIQRVNSCAAGDVAVGPVAIASSSVGTGEPVNPDVVDAAPAVADSTGEISLDGSASESGQLQDLRQGTSTQSQSSPRSSHHNSTSEDASPAQDASQGSPLASQSVSPSVSNESLRSPANSSLGSHSQGSLQQPNAEVVRREAVSKSQESSLHSEQDLPLHSGGGGQGAVIGGSSASNVVNAHNHSRLGLDGAGRGSFAEDSDQDGDGSVTIEDDGDEGDIDLTDLQSHSHGSDDQF